MAGDTIDREAVAGPARTLDRLAPEFTDAERRQLLALLAAASAAEVEPFDMTGGSFSDALRPLIVTTAIGMSQAGSGPTPPSTTTPPPAGASGSGKK